MRIIKLFLSEIFGLLESLITNYPNTNLGKWLRSRFWYYRLRIVNPKTISVGVQITGSDTFICGEFLALGPNVKISNSDGYGIYIGQNVSIGPNTYIRTSNHRFTSLSIPIQEQGHYSIPINCRFGTFSVVIEDDVWIGANVVLLPGAHISFGSVIGAGVIVDGYIEPLSIVVSAKSPTIAFRK